MSALPTLPAAPLPHLAFAAPPRLMTTGLHARSRHPVYLGSLLYLAALTGWAPCPLAIAALLTITAAFGADSGAGELSMAGSPWCSG